MTRARPRKWSATGGSVSLVSELVPDSTGPPSRPVDGRLAPWTPRRLDPWYTQPGGHRSPGRIVCRQPADGPVFFFYTIRNWQANCVERAAKGQPIKSATLFSGETTSRISWKTSLKFSTRASLVHGPQTQNNWGVTATTSKNSSLEIGQPDPVLPQQTFRRNCVPRIPDPVRTFDVRCDSIITTYAGTVPGTNIL